MHKCRYCGKPANHYELLTDEWYCPNCAESARDRWIEAVPKIVDYHFRNESDKNG